MLFAAIRWMRRAKHAVDITRSTVNLPGRAEQKARAAAAPTAKREYLTILVGRWERKIEKMSQCYSWNHLRKSAHVEHYSKNKCRSH